MEGIQKKRLILYQKTAHAIKRRNDCHRQRSNGRSLDWSTWEGFMEELACELREWTDKEDVWKQKWRQRLFKARKKKMHSRQRKQEWLMNRNLKQPGVFPEGEAQGME